MSKRGVLTGSRDATSDYKARVAIMAIGNRNEHGLREDASIVLAMILKDGHTEAESLAAVREGTPCQTADEAYFRELDRCTKATMDAYMQIQNFPLSRNVQSEADGYRKFAKEHMNRTGTAILGPEDDLAILRKFRQEILKNGFKGSVSLKQQKQLEEAVLPILRQALREASPVAREAGRNPDKYSASVIEDVREWQESQLRISGMALPITQNLYMEHLRTRQRELDEYCAAHSIECMDVSVAKELLEEQQGERNILCAISGSSPAVHDMNEEESKIYAMRILRIAHAVRKSELEIVHAEKITVPSGMPYRKMREEHGITALALYRHIMRNRLDAAPSFLNRMTDPMADLEAVDWILSKFPDIDRYELKNAIRKASPKACMPDTEESYVDRLVLAVEWKQTELKWKRERTSKMVKTFRKSRETLENDGANLEAIAFQKDCMVARRMLQQETTEETILQVIASMAKGASSSPMEYAERVLAKSKAILSKADAIRKASALPKGENITPSDEYIHRMQEAAKGGNVTPALDAVVAEGMLAGKRRKIEVMSAIRECSPCAEESGDAGSYAERVAEEASLGFEKKQIQSEKTDNVPAPEDPEEGPAADSGKASQFVRKFEPALLLERIRDNKASHMHF